MAKYGYLKEGRVIALNDEEGFAQTHDSVKNLWRMVPEETQIGSTLDGSKWSHPAPQRRLRISPVEFKMAFAMQERLAIRQARSYSGDDPAQAEAAMVIDDWFGIIEDPRLTMVDLELPQTKEGLSYLVSAGILTAARKAEIEAGLPA